MAVLCMMVVTISAFVAINLVARRRRKDGKWHFYRIGTMKRWTGAAWEQRVVTPDELVTDRDERVW